MLYIRPVDDKPVSKEDQEDKAFMYERILSTHGNLRDKPCIPEDLGFVRLEDNQLIIDDCPPLPVEWMKVMGHNDVVLIGRGYENWWHYEHRGSRKAFQAMDLYDLWLGLKTAGIHTELSPPRADGP